MSDLMLLGVLRMPMDDADPLAVAQYVARGRQAADEIERLRAEVAGLREDAERYRWLREGCCDKDTEASRIAKSEYGMDWDAAIDAALAARKGEA